MFFSRTIPSLIFLNSEVLSLLSSPGGEFVNANNVGDRWVGVDVINLSQVLLEDLRSELVLSLGSVVLAVLNDVSHELVVSIGHDLHFLEEASIGVAKKGSDSERFHLFI